MARQKKKGGAGSEKSAMFFIRRQVAKILKTVLAGDSQRRASASLQSLIYQPSIRSKKATMALTCQTLKYLPIIREILASTDLLNKKTKNQVELLYVLVFDLLFGEGVDLSGTAEGLVLSRKNALRASLARILVKRNASNVEELVSSSTNQSGSKTLRFLRVNTLKMDVTEALNHLQKSLDTVKQDDLIPELLLVPSGIEFHKHPLVMEGALILQGKSSCMPALALAPQPDWQVLDACAAPGNKTVQLAALMNGKGKVLACEVNKNRLLRLKEIVKLAGASNVEILHRDFLTLDSSVLPFSQIEAILLDPSCSGSGTTLRRMDYLLPSTTGKPIDSTELLRVEKLAAFQERALRHALSFPYVKRVVYSTCSIHQRENEDVISAVLSFASDLGFCLASPFPDWPQRGLPIFEGAHHLVRTEPSEEMEGFFVALFVREDNCVDHNANSKEAKKLKNRKKLKKGGM